MMGDMQAVRAAAEFILSEREIYHHGSAAWRVASSLLTLTDPTPLTEEWIKKTLPPTGSPSPSSRESADYSTAIGKMSWIMWESGLCLYFFGEGVYWRNMTRGQFRMMTLAIGLELMEDKE